MASKDQMIGAGILGVSIIIIILYLYLVIIPDYREWAITIPVVIAVLAVLGIAAWIGYTMATTPPPKPLEDIPELKETEEKK